MELTQIELLESLLLQHPAVTELEPGFLTRVKQVHHASIAELEKAITMLLEHPDQWHSPTGMLLSPQCWQNGKWTVQVRKRTSTYPAHPLWERAWQWYQTLSEEQQHVLNLHIKRQLCWIKQEHWQHDLFHPQSPGRAYLVAHYENVINQQLAAFRQVHQRR